MNKLQLARAKVRASSASPVHHFFQPICKCGNEVDGWVKIGQLYEEAWLSPEKNQMNGI
jgi:hypothetical protein